MRRKAQELSRDNAIKILQEATSGVLAVNGDGGYPYTVPVSHVLADGKIYFHSALQGHKIEAIRRDPRVSFCVIARDEVIAREFTTYFRSVVAFGTARIIEDKAEKMTALRLLAAKYADRTVTAEMTDNEIAKGFDHLHMIAITIEHLTAKQAIELVNTPPQTPMK